MRLLLPLIFILSLPRAHAQVDGQSGRSIAVMPCYFRYTLLDGSQWRLLIDTAAFASSDILGVVQRLNENPDETPVAERPPPPVGPHSGMSDRLLAFLRDPQTGMIGRFVQFPFSRHLQMSLMGRVRGYSVPTGQKTTYVGSAAAGLEMVQRFNRDTILRMNAVFGAGATVDLDTSMEMGLGGEAMFLISIDP